MDGAPGFALIVVREVAWYSWTDPSRGTVPVASVWLLCRQKTDHCGNPMGLQVTVVENLDSEGVGKAPWTLKGEPFQAPKVPE